MFRILVMVLALTVALTVGAVPAGAQPRVGARPDAPQNLRQLGTFADFNGDNRTDLAVGAPQENVGATADAGAVSIFYGIAAGTGLPSASQTLLQADVEAGDQFGAALTAEFFDVPIADLVVGAPGENVGAIADAGAANAFLNTTTGGVLPAVSGPALLQDNPEAGDQFGAALTAGRFDGGVIADLVVGAPGENVGATVDAGAANLFSDTAGGLPPVSGPALLQDNPEAGDRFGAALTAGFVNGGFEDLVVGAPGENVGATVDAGAANFFSDTAGVLPAVSGPALLQDNPEAGDQFGAALTAKYLSGGAFIDLVGGAPGEDVGATVDAGAVNVFANLGVMLPGVSSQTLAQANVEVGDRFGAALDA